MIRLAPKMVSVLAGASAVCLSPVANADENAPAIQKVTYVVDSPFNDIAVANGIEYFDGAGRVLIRNVSLPWRMTVMVANPTSLGFDGAEVRADWRPDWAPGKWVSTRVYLDDKLICDNTLDVGNAACYGSSNFKS
jgi:hypothetical protein